MIEIVEPDLPDGAEWCTWCDRAIVPERYRCADGDVVLVYVHDDAWHPQDYPEEPS